MLRPIDRFVAHIAEELAALDALDHVPVFNFLVYGTTLLQRTNRTQLEVYPARRVAFTILADLILCE